MLILVWFIICILFYFVQMVLAHKSNCFPIDMIFKFYITASANINDMDEDAKKFPIVTQTEKNIELNTVMSNSFGFGGTNATLIFEKV